jgi:hypothetical protein
MMKKKQKGPIQHDKQEKKSGTENSTVESLCEEQTEKLAESCPTDSY